MWGENGMDVYNPGHNAKSMSLRRETMAGGGAYKGNWRAEALEVLAMSKERERKMNARFGTLGSASGGGISGMGSGAGPVLWPGMEGLGIHKVKSASAEDVEDTNSDADYTDVPAKRQRPLTVTIKDDTGK